MMPLGAIRIRCVGLESGLGLENLIWLLLFQKKSKQGGWGYTFSKIPKHFSFFYFTPGNSRQSKAQPWIFHKIVFGPIGNSKTKNKDPWKFRTIFSWSPLEIAHAISPLEIPYPQPPCLDFFWNSPIRATEMNYHP